MKSFKPISISPIRVSAKDSQEILELKREFNTKLREIGQKANDAIKSLVGGTLDMGLWCNGEIITVSSNDFHPHAPGQAKKDWGYRHRLGVVPRYAIQLMPKGPFAWNSASEWPLLRKGTTAWTDTHVYLRPSTDICGYDDTDACTLEVLLIP